jgi:hypothetical protein
MILGRERIDASIDADVANKELRALDKVCDLIDGSPAETTGGGCHRRAPSLPSPRIWRSELQSAGGGLIRKRAAAPLKIRQAT